MLSQRHKVDVTQSLRNYRAPDSDTDSAVFSFLSSLDCPHSLAIWLLYNNREHQQLVDLGFQPEWFNDSSGFRDAYTAHNFLSKADFFKLSVSKEAVAYAKFFEYEELCKHTNNRFRNLSLDPNYHGSNVWLLNATIRKIDEILGDFDAEELVNASNWGPGVTTLLKGNHVSAVNKFHLENGITRDLYALVGEWFPLAYPRWHEHLVSVNGDSCFNYQVGNTIVTVPKNSKTDRVIAVEPGLNLWFQKGCGTMIRRRLRRRGVNLSDQGVNQRLSKLGSVSSDLATVDFSSASDSISRELVRELLPPRWFALLNACRTPLGVHDKKIIRWEKFSSMGNGFTFELESLIFYAAALAVCDLEKSSTENVSVYGDDVIIPSSCFDLFSSFSMFLGFRVNQKKSYASGYFRESCGAHWFNGVDCKPIFLKERLSNVQSVYKLVNSVRLLAHRRNFHHGCDVKLLNTWRHLLSRIPKRFRYFGSLGYGDGCIVGNFDEATPVRAGRGYEGHYVQFLVEAGITQPFEEEGLLLSRLKDAASNDSEFIPIRKTPAGVLSSTKLTSTSIGNAYVMRSSTKLRVTRTLVQQWYNLGSWF